MFYKPNTGEQTPTDYPQEKASWACVSSQPQLVVGGRFFCGGGDGRRN